MAAGNPLFNYRASLLPSDGEDVGVDGAGGWREEGDVVSPLDLHLGSTIDTKSVSP